MHLHMRTLRCVAVTSPDCTATCAVAAYFGAMVGLIQPFFMMSCDGRKLR